MELLRKYGVPLAVILVIAVLILICVVAGIRGSGRDLPTWKGLDTSDLFRNNTASGSSGINDPVSDPANERQIPDA